MAASRRVKFFSSERPRFLKKARLPLFIGYVNNFFVFFNQLDQIVRWTAGST